MLSKGYVDQESSLRDASGPAGAAARTRAARESDVETAAQRNVLLASSLFERDALRGSGVLILEKLPKLSH